MGAKAKSLLDVAASDTDFVEGCSELFKTKRATTVQSNHMERLVKLARTSFQIDPHAPTYLVSCDWGRELVEKARSNVSAKTVN